MNRWYDKNQNLAKQLDTLLKAPVELKIKIIRGVLDIIQDCADDDVIGRFDFPSDIDQWSKRDYDDEAATWIVINNLKYVNEAILEKVALHIEQNIA